jgi:hypothetical protein
MRKMHTRRFVLVSPLLVLAAGPSFADVLPDAVRSCVKIAGDTERLACFDREIARLPSAVSKPSSAAAIPLTPEQKLGLSSSRVQQLESPSSQAAPPTELHAHILSTSLSADGMLNFVLDNAQVWHQTVSKSDLLFRQGDAVTISPGALGSFWLSTDKHHSVRVKRVR